MSDRSPRHHPAHQGPRQSRREAFITMTPRERAADIIATFVGVLDRFERVAPHVRPALQRIERERR